MAKAETMPRFVALEESCDREKSRRGGEMSRDGEDRGLNLNPNTPVMLKLKEMEHSAVYLLLF